MRARKLSDRPPPGSLPLDLVDFVEALNDNGAKFLIVGGHAVGFHGHARATEDFDVWIGSDRENIDAVAEALRTFQAPASVARAVRDLGPGEFVRFGQPPVRIDILQTVDGLNDFDACWMRRESFEREGLVFPVIELGDLLHNKSAAGRPQDMVDVEHLDRVRRKER